MMLTHIHVRRWLVKLSAQAGGRGHLYLDAHDFHWHRQAVRREKQWGAVPWDELSTHNDVLCFCAELSYVLPMKAKFARACEAAYGTWARFLAELMLSGGLIEAHPNGAVPDLTPLTAELLVHPRAAPGGECEVLAVLERRTKRSKDDSVKMGDTTSAMLLPLHGNSPCWWKCPAFGPSAPVVAPKPEKGLGKAERQAASCHHLECSKICIPITGQ